MGFEKKKKRRVNHSICEPCSPTLIITTDQGMIYNYAIS